MTLADLALVSALLYLDLRQPERDWRSIIAAGRAGQPDLYQGRFGELRAPTLLLHGSRDPCIEPGELEAAQRALPAAQVALLDAGRPGGEAQRHLVPGEPARIASSRSRPIPQEWSSTTSMKSVRSRRSASSMPRRTQPPVQSASPSTP